MAELLPSHLQIRADAELGAAFRRVEAALPEGWEFATLTRHPDQVTRLYSDGSARAWRASVRPPDSGQGWLGYSGSTAVEALTRLAEALESR